MPRIEEYQIHPWGWENDPHSERYKISILDMLSTITYTNNALFFEVEDSQRTKVVAILKEGLARALSQVRHLVGTIEKDEDGSYYFVRTKYSTVRFAVQHLDTPGDKYPSFEDISRAHFRASILGDVSVLSNDPMTCGSKPEADPDNHPVICSMKANFVRGGLILNTHFHHWSNGLMGSTGFHRQWAANCYAVAHKTEFPFFDPKWLDRSAYGVPGFEKPTIAEEPQTEAPRSTDSNPQIRPSQSLLFHLPKSKATELKKAASANIGARISTYNAAAALMWRVCTKLRAPLYDVDAAYKVLWAQGVSIFQLFDPPLPLQLQGNLQFDITSETTSVPPLTLAEIISEAPLSKLAGYIREMTESVTLDMLFDRTRKFALVRKKQDLAIRLDTFPPLSLLVSDWRYGDLVKLDFGFANPSAWRHLFGGVPLSQAVVYPPRKGPAGDDEGMEFIFTFETELTQKLLSDPEWNKYFEFRGVDLPEDGSIDSLQPLESKL